MNGGTRLRARVAAVCFGAAAALAMGTQAQAVPGPAESIAVSPGVVGGGVQITIVGSGWLCAADVDIFIDNGGLQLVTSVAFDDIVDGGFSVMTAAPNEAGDYDVIAEYGNAQSSVGCEGSANAPFTVIPTTTTTTTTTVPATTTTTVPATTTTTTTTTTTVPASSTTTTTLPATTTTLSDTTTSTTTTTTLVGAGGPTTTTIAGNAAPSSTAGPATTLPVTGTSTGTILPIAIITTALGGLLMATTRRRTVS